MISIRGMIWFALMFIAMYSFLTLMSAGNPILALFTGGAAFLIAIEMDNHDMRRSRR